jgi:hypothetical protein
MLHLILGGAAVLHLFWVAQRFTAAVTALFQKRL